ncbi:pyridoxamine 5'-phosphate oxidase family protein [Streptomyces sp. N2-109]|uniref:Pyridoxamine 5'-phosphate oxidase family protein n=1 Tax=Streptomyces gossypii TaxID=2883101 RepID=A0ABT2JR83_9ACTN|nr:pyridoxamine 5'-phosphate oxidase family protein [Streptomyces gossypii]MCT2590399.1 pyridoxamine 5'-phosphate oxidase family protein [Streptomyces gossypii]
MADTTLEPRTGAERKRDLLDRLRTEHDVWVASADREGAPCLVPLSLHWDGTWIWLSTRYENPTGVNLRENGVTRLALQSTEYVAMIDGTVETVGQEEIATETADAFAARGGWDPREARRGRYVYFKVTLTGVQAFQGRHELPGRHLMVDGDWLV